MQPARTEVDSLLIRIFVMPANCKMSRRVLALGVDDDDDERQSLRMRFRSRSTTIIAAKLVMSSVP